MKRRRAGKIDADGLAVLAGPAEWTQPGEWYETNGSHNVSKALVMGIARYTAWRLRGPAGQTVYLGVYDSAEAARAACAADADRKLTP